MSRYSEKIEFSFFSSRRAAYWSPSRCFAAPDQDGRVKTPGCGPHTQPVGGLKSCHPQSNTHADVPLFSNTFQKVRILNDKKQLPLWAKFLKLEHNPKLAEELFDIVRDMLFMRMTSEKLSYDFLAGVFNGIKLTSEKLRNLK